MPFAPPRLCGCGKIVPAGERCACRRASDRTRKARHDRRRPTARQRGYNHEWQKARAAYLSEHPHCIRCFKPATVVDHIRPHRGDDVLFWDRTNWQPLCFICHNKHKQREERGPGAAMSVESLLWAAVIQNAIEDARGHVKGSKASLAEHESRAARVWLTRPNRDFNTVCHLAGLDPMAVRERCLRMFPRTDELENA